MTLFIVLTNQVIMRVSGLALMTDQAVAVVLSPALLLWEAEPVIGGRKVGRYLDMAAREWNLFFKDNINNRLSGDYVQHIFNFLNGQNQTLRKLADQKISSNFGYHLNRSEACDKFFGRFSIRKTLDGSENKHFSELKPNPNLGSPFSLHKKTPNKSPFVKSSCNNNTTDSPPSDVCSRGPANLIKQVFGPSKDDFEPEAEILPLFGFQIGSRSIGGGQGDKLVCKIGRRFISVSWAPNHCLFLTAKDLSAVILSPEASPSPELNLFLSSAGCLQVLKISQTVKKIPHTAFSSKSPANQKKIVLKLRDFTPDMRENLWKSFDKSMDTRYCEVIPTFGNLLSFGIVDFEQAFTDPGVRVLQMKILNKYDDEDDRSSRSSSGFDFSRSGHSEADDADSGSAGSYQGSPAKSSCDSDDDDWVTKRIKTIINEKITASLLNELLSNIEEKAEKRMFVDSIVDEMLEDVVTTSSWKTRKLHLENSQKIGGKDFDNLNFSHLPELHNEEPEPVAKKPKISTAPNFVDPSSNSINNNFHPSSQIKTPIPHDINVHKFTTPYKSQLNSKDNKGDVTTCKPQAVKKQDIIDLTKSLSDSSCCDDCRYVTRMHKVRMLTGKYKCKCHPCVLRQEVIRLGRTDPFKIIKINDFMGPGDYWSQPWLVDLYEDIIKGCSGLTQDRIYEMTGSYEILGKSKIYGRKKKEQEYARLSQK